MKLLHEFLRAYEESRYRTNGREPKRIVVSQSFVLDLIIEGGEPWRNCVICVGLGPPWKGSICGKIVEVRPYPPIPYFIFWN
ncbi:MAG: hypothetical protein DMF06_15990 [Verrucomicrobia bacterium]|nr:MAG: hypothetical protein DMF06_15990 [Verrucomicrobiota bacterium]